MSTYNGEKYLDQQIQSLVNQEDVEIEILVRDDGSNDKTIIKLEEWSKKINLIYYMGENKKTAKSFMDLVMSCDLSFDYYAFSDQDDVWESKKLIKAIEKIQKYEKEPALYISTTKVVDQNLKFICKRQISSFNNLENALLKNEAVGCTEVLNQKMMLKLKKYNPRFLKMHDSWTCRVCYAIGGYVYIDNNSYILYRQHENNVIGFKKFWLDKFKEQFNTAFYEKIRLREKFAEELLIGYKDDIDEHNKVILETFKNYPYSYKSKLKLLTSKNIQTPYMFTNIKIKLAILINKF